MGHGSLADGWICVCMCLKVLLLTNPFLIMQLERITIRSMNLISLSLDMVPGLKRMADLSILSDILKVKDAGTVGISQVPVFGW